MLVCSCAVLPAMRFWGGHNAVLCVAVATKMLVEYEWEADCTGGLALYLAPALGAGGLS